jgi:hypothetical protein
MEKVIDYLAADLKKADGRARTRARKQAAKRRTRQWHLVEQWRAYNRILQPSGTMDFLGD